jgi:threonyl-tRNA synthetase
LEYTDENGDKKTPIMIHRAIAGSLERFMAVMIEHYAGAFPTWLAPVQVGILPVSEKFSDYANRVNSVLRESGIRVEMYDQDEGLGKRIALATKQKIPYLLILGEKEIEEKTVTVRQRGNKKQQTIAVDKFVKMIEKEIGEKK